MALNNIEMTELLFEAIDAIIELRIRNLPFDRTVTATIIDITMILHHKYKVTTDDNITFDAYSIDDYNLGDRVYVRIPEGDYTQLKIITGKFIPIYNDDEINKSEELISLLARIQDLYHTYIEIIDNIESNIALIQQYTNENYEEYKELIEVLNKLNELSAAHSDFILNNIEALEKEVNRLKQQLEIE